METTSHYQLVGKNIELNGRSREFYVCGPRDFERDVRAWLVELDVPDHFIRSEMFDRSDAGNDTTAPALAAARILFARSGLTADWTSDGAASLLDAAESVGLTPDFGCRTGSCGACAAKIVDGRVGYGRPPSIAPPADMVLLCCARPASTAVTVDP